MATLNTSPRASRTQTDNIQSGTQQAPFRPQTPSARKMRMQLILAAVLAVFGMILFLCSFIVPPTGIIDSSVLVAGGEAFTFSGSLIGIDVRAKMKYMDRPHEEQDHTPSDYTE